MYWWLYNVAFVTGFTLLLPRYLWRMCRRGGYARGFTQRFARYDEQTLSKLEARRRIWIHAVSVGEVYVALRFIETYRRQHPELAFVLTTNTSTGHRIAEARLHADDVLLYFPIDLPVIVNRVLERLRPEALVLTECELWPNLVRLADDRGVPIALLNGRVSDSSYRGYRMCRPLFRNLLQRFAVALVQGEQDASRIRELGARPERTHVLGTAKYDVATKDTSKMELIRGVLDAAGFPAGAPVLVGGSTWPGEERILLEVYEHVRQDVKALKLVLVPRHFERAAEVERELNGVGANYVKRSALEPGKTGKQDADVLLLDSTGELVGVYAHATVIFVGKSLSNHGGQNIIEPALFGKPVLFGPNMENFPVVVEDFLTADAAVQVADQAELEARVRELLVDPAAADALGARAAELVSLKRGCMERSVELIGALL
jgi:3-deoxy-D-manno-octulosonic-acid transferase